MDPIMCLAVALFFEARAEPVSGMEAVANVIINRVEDTRYPNSVCGVVNEHKAFSYTHDGLHDDPTKFVSFPDRVAWDTCQEVAKYTLQGDVIGTTSTHYHAESVLPYWANHFTKDGKVGGHIFYTNDTPYK